MWACVGGHVFKCKHYQYLDASICVWICVGSLDEAFGCWLNEEQSSGRERRWEPRPFRWFSQWSNHKQSSEWAVQTGGYPPSQASLFLPFFSYICHFHALASVCFLVGGWLTLPRVGEGGLCRSVCKWQTVLTAMSRVMGEVSSLFFSYANLIIFPNPCLLFAICKYCLCGTLWHADFPIKPLFLGIS